MKNNRIPKDSIKRIITHDFYPHASFLLISNHRDYYFKCRHCPVEISLSDRRDDNHQNAVSLMYLTDRNNRVRVNIKILKSSSILTCEEAVMNEALE